MCGLSMRDACVVHRLEEGLLDGHSLSTPQCPSMIPSFNDPHILRDIKGKPLGEQETTDLQSKCSQVSFLFALNLP